MKTIWALDTDTKGALSCINNQGVFVFKFPNLQEAHGVSKKTKKPKMRTRLNYPELINTFQLALSFGRPDIVVFEAQRGRPGQSSVATYTFAECNGFLRGAMKMLLGHDVTYLETPAATWKPALNLDDDKSKAHKMAKAICPGLAVVKQTAANDSVCESFLLAVYANIHATGRADSVLDFKNVPVKVFLKGTH